jgi:hypothetical protein
MVHHQILRQHLVDLLLDIQDVQDSSGAPPPPPVAVKSKIEIPNLGYHCYLQKEVMHLDSSRILLLVNQHHQHLL